MAAARLSAASTLSSLLAGLLGAMLAFGASNLYFYYFGPYLKPNLPSRTVLPDSFSFLQIDAYVGAGCAYAGALTGPSVAGFLDSQHRRLIPTLYTVVLGTTVSLIVNALLLAMSNI